MMELSQVNNNAGDVHNVGASPELPEFHVVVRFGRGIPSDEQGRALLALEKFLRGRGVAAEVFKPTAPDDLKSRREMTAYERANL